MKKQRIIVGLGNAAKKYTGTRHNLGFEVIDSFIEKYNLSYDRLGTAARIARTTKSGYLRKKLDNQAIICRPLSFMNTSGVKIKKVLDKLGAQVNDLLVIYDDIDLDLGRMRVRPSGSAGGHKGIRSIIRQLNTREFARLKLGIGPQGELPAEKFVLNKFYKSELPVKNKIIEKSIEAIVDFCNQTIDDLMSKYNGVNYVEDESEK